MDELKMNSGDSTQNLGSGENNVNTIEARFVQLCKKDLQLYDSNFLAQGKKLLDETKSILLANLSSIGNGIPEEAEQYWFAFVLYSVRRLSDNSVFREKGLSICQILRASRINMVDFCKEFPQFLIKVGSILTKLYGADWEKRIEAKELQTNFLHMAHLSKHYKRAYQQFIMPAGVNDGKHSTVGYYLELYRFGWLLFLAFRAHMLCRVNDLRKCTDGGVSIVATLIINAPARFRAFDTVDPDFIVRKDDKVDLLASLCKVYETSEDDLRKTLEKVNSVIIDLLKKKPRPASECKSKDMETILTDGLVYFEELTDEPYLSSNVQLLEQNHSDTIYLKGEFDERTFLEEDESLLGSGSLPRGPINMNRTGRQGRKRRHPSDPSWSDLAVEIAKWLKTVLTPVQSRPSVEPDIEEQQITCEICIEPIISRQKLFRNPNNKCCHNYCTDCIIHYISLKLEENSSSGTINCPSVKCDQTLDPNQCASIIDPKLRAQWCDLLSESAIKSLPLPPLEKYSCPYMKKSQCHDCRKLFCFDCKGVWEGGFGPEKRVGFGKWFRDEHIGQKNAMKRLAMQSDWRGGLRIIDGEGDRGAAMPSSWWRRWTELAKSTAGTAPNLVTCVESM